MKDIELFNKHTQPPSWALKDIQAGRLKGKTDINPQWRIIALTDMYGLCGFGWKYQIDKIEYQQADNKEIAVFAHISLFIKKDSIWSDAIPGTGGSMFVSNEKNGAYTSDEAEKMAVTDAISVACKLIGIAGNVYSGSKYLGTIPKAPEPPKTPEKPTLVVATKEYNACVDAMFKKNDKTNENYSISDFRIKYEISEEVEKLLKEDYGFKLKAQ